MHFRTEQGEIVKDERKVRKKVTKSFLCDICGQYCVTESGLAIHRTKHTDEKPFQVCSNNFYLIRKNSFFSLNFVFDFSASYVEKLSPVDNTLKIIKNAIPMNCRSFVIFAIKGLLENEICRYIFELF